MTILTGTIRTARPLDDVFAYLADFTTAAEWDPGVESSVAETDGGPGEGARYLVTAGFAGRSLAMTYEMTAYEPPNRVVLRGSTGNFVAVDEIRIDSVEGRTQVRYRAEFTLSGFLRILEPFMRPAFRRLGDKALNGLAAALDGTRTD